MVRKGWIQTLANIKEGLTLIQNGAERTRAQFEALCREAESFKVEFLEQCLEEEREAAARQRGFVSLIGNRDRIRGGLLAAAGGLIFGGLMTRNKFGALKAGMSGFDGVLRAFGETKWAVSLGKKMVVIPRDSILPEGTWVTWESLKGAMEELKGKASAGRKSGNLNNVIAKLKQGRRKLVYLSGPVARLSPAKKVNSS